MTETNMATNQNDSKANMADIQKVEQGSPPMTYKQAN